MKGIKILVLGCVGMLGLILANLHAEASLHHRVNAAMCQERGTGTNSFDYSEYRVTNSGTSGTRYLLCSLAVPYSSTSDSGTLNVDVYTNESHNSDSITMALYRISATTGSIVESKFDYGCTDCGNETLTQSIGFYAAYDYLVKLYVPENSGAEVTKVFSLWYQWT